ncbi:MAG: ATP-binding protein [Porphyromonadaceae bacterium]|nr:MAG: ATP-binding protein [Porphyromonadaceae bacterium]
MNETTLKRMNQMKLFGMHQSFQGLVDTKGHQKLTQDELVSLLVQAEWEDRENRKIERSMQNARFRYQATFEEIDYHHPRKLDKNLMLRFTDCGYINRKENILITGPTGLGKSFLSSALGHQGCMHGYRVLYLNVQKLFTRLKVGKAEGSYPKEMTRMEKQDLLILDNFGLQVLDAQNRMALLEIIEDRHERKSTIITSQLPLEKWYEVIGESTVADSIMDRLYNGSHKIALDGPSMRKKK